MPTPPTNSGSTRRSGGKPRTTGAGLARGAHLVTLPALVLAALPKCPVCLMNVLGIVGIGAVVGPRWFFPLTVASVAVCATVFGLAARRVGFIPFGLAVAGGALVVLDHATASRPAVKYAAMGVLLLASSWFTWASVAASRAKACECGMHLRRSRRRESPTSLLQRRRQS